MPVIRHPGQLPVTDGPGWSQQEWAGPAVFGEPVPMRASRYRIEAGATGPDIPLQRPGGVRLRDRWHRDGGRRR